MNEREEEHVCRWVDNIKVNRVEIGLGWCGL
jgi:hypothetical protein